jgi:hypothetical protein
MSRASQQALRLRRERLLIRNAELRQQLARQAQDLAAPLALADRSLDGLRWLRQHPEWPLGALTVWIVFRPRRAWRWAARAWWLWRTARQLQRLWTRVAYQ